LLRALECSAQPVHDGDLAVGEVRPLLPVGLEVVKPRTRGFDEVVPLRSDGAELAPTVVEARVERLAVPLRRASGIPPGEERNEAPALAPQRVLDPEQREQ